MMMMGVVALEEPSAAPPSDEPVATEPVGASVVPCFVCAAAERSVVAPTDTCSGVAVMAPGVVVNSATRCYQNRGGPSAHLKTKNVFDLYSKTAPLPPRRALLLKSQGGTRYLLNCGGAHFGCEGHGGHDGPRV